MSRSVVKSAVRSARMSREKVAREIRDGILSGTYSAGDRLPTAETLAETLGACYVTVLHGMEMLGEEGFVVSNRRTGTFVAEAPPHLYECALVIPLPEDAGALDAQPFWKLLCEETRKSNKYTAPWRVRPWFSEGHPESLDQFLLSQAQEEAITSGASAGLKENLLFLAREPLAQDALHGLARRGLFRPEFKLRGGLIDEPCNPADGDAPRLAGLAQ